MARSSFRGLAPLSAATAATATGRSGCETRDEAALNGSPAETGGAIVIQIASYFGLPVSTTHVVTSAVTGTGLASHSGRVSWKVFRAIMLAWAVTLPFCAIVAAVIYYLLDLVM
jgi:phosphate/sulfate permease